MTKRMVNEWERENASGGENEMNFETANEHVKARILKGVGGLYTALICKNKSNANDQADARPELSELSELPDLIECRAKGAFRREGVRPLPGDLVWVEKQKEGDARIAAILPRKNALIRPAGANIDCMLFVVAARSPDPDLFLLDKMIAVAEHNGIKSVLLINKDDLAPDYAQTLCDIYTTAGYSTIRFSAKNADAYGESVEQIRRILRGKTCFFTGASGVGKSSVIRVLFPALSEEIATGTLSKKIERGKHTTRKTELYPISGGYVADTPGFSMLEIARFNLIPKESLLAAFPDIERYAVGCRYTDCTHTCEDGCGVLAALHEHRLAESRHQSYLQLRDELKET